MPRRWHASQRARDSCRPACKTREQQCVDVTAGLQPCARLGACCRSRASASQSPREPRFRVHEIPCLQSTTTTKHVLATSWRTRRNLRVSRRVGELVRPGLHCVLAAGIPSGQDALPQRLMRQELQHSSCKSQLLHNIPE